PGPALAGAARSSGGPVVVRDALVQALGGLLAPPLPRLGVGVRPTAMAVGHVVPAVDQGALDCSRRHERVHVEQAERWGPLFPLAYAGASLAALLRGQDPYHDNAFEREACAASEG